MDSLPSEASSEQPESKAMPRELEIMVLAIVNRVRFLREANKFNGVYTFFGRIGAPATEVEMFKFLPKGASQKEETVAKIRKKAAGMNADFVVMAMESWGLEVSSQTRARQIVEQFGSIGDSPFRVDQIAFSVETYLGRWMFQAKIVESPGGKKTFGPADFFKADTWEGTFANILPNPMRPPSNAKH